MRQKKGAGEKKGGKIYKKIIKKIPVSAGLGGGEVE